MYFISYRMKMKATLYALILSCVLTRGESISSANQDMSQNAQQPFDYWLPMESGLASQSGTASQNDEYSQSSQQNQESPSAQTYQQEDNSWSQQSIAYQSSDVNGESGTEEQQYSATTASWQPTPAVDDSSAAPYQSASTYAPSAYRQNADYSASDNSGCAEGTRRSVSDQPSTYIICDNGIWIPMTCAPGTLFNPAMGQCMIGRSASHVSRVRSVPASSSASSQHGAGAQSNRLLQQSASVPQQIYGNNYMQGAQSSSQQFNYAQSTGNNNSYSSSSSYPMQPQQPQQPTYARPQQSQLYQPQMQLVRQPSQTNNYAVANSGQQQGYQQQSRQQQGQQQQQPNKPQVYPSQVAQPQPSIMNLQSQAASVLQLQQTRQQQSSGTRQTSWQPVPGSQQQKQPQQQQLQPQAQLWRASGNIIPQGWQPAPTSRIQTWQQPVGNSRPAPWPSMPSHQNVQQSSSSSSGVVVQSQPKQPVIGNYNSNLNKSQQQNQPTGTYATNLQANNQNTQQNRLPSSWQPAASLPVQDQQQALLDGSSKIKITVDI